MKKIFLVDDSRAALSALSSQLDPQEFSVGATTSPLAAVALIRAAMPDCVLTDYEMPEIDGPGLCRLLKKEKGLEHIPVLILTSRTDTEHLLLAIAAGADDFISKDCDVRVIVAKIDAMVRLKRTHDELSQLRRVAAIKQIIATYNHEFNNPLAIALGNLSYLRASLTDPEQKAWGLRVHDALDRMTQIVRKIRDLRDYVEDNYAEAESMIAVGATSSDP